MKSINRITALLFLTAFSCHFVFSQSINIGRKLEKAASVAVSNVPASPPGKANVPQCAFDAANHALEQEGPHLHQEIWQYVKNAVPVLAQANQTEMVEELLTISVVVHIIHSGEPIGQGQNLTDEQVYAQIAILNQDFAGINSEYFQTPTKWAGANGVPNIEFCLATVDPSGNPTNGITRHNLQVTGTSYNNSNINSSIKPQTDWNATKYMNVWVLPIPGTTAAGGVVGVANYPTPSQIGQERDGIVVDYRWFGAPGYAASGYRPLTHETGHFLGLPHTFDDFSCSADDGISDTPNIDDATANYIDLDCTDGYADGPVSCGNEAMYVNYMDYVDENCYTSFTQGQVNVMRAVLNGTSQGYGYGSRLSLLQNAQQLCILPNHDAGIARIVTPGPVTCTGSTVAPVVTLRNFGQSDLTSVSIKYKAGNGTLMNYDWQGSLFPGENADVALPAILLPDGLHDFTVFTSNPNGMADGRSFNDTLVREQINYLTESPNLIENFEDETALPSNEGLYALDLSGDGFRWQLNTQASAYGQGTKSVVFNNFQNGPEGTLDALVTRHYDLTNMDDAILIFDVAYAQKNNMESDSLIILVQLGCTQLYDIPIYWKGGASLATAPNTSSQFTPTAAQWRTEVLDLSVFAGEPDISFAFVNLSDGGNRLFLDNIRFGRSCSAITTSFDILPNGCSTSGNCTGFAQVFVENDHGGLQYKWSGQPSSYNESYVEGLCTGTVSVTITDAFGCQVTAADFIPQSDGPSLVIDATPEATYNGQNGTATVNVSGGTGPYNYYWSNGAQMLNSNETVSTISNLAPGNYAVTVEDANQCSSNSEVAVGSVCTGFTVSAQTSNATCFGGANGSITAIMSNGTAPYNFIWSNGSTSQVNNNLLAGAYSLTVTDANACPAVQNATVSQPTPLLPNASATNVTTAISNDGSVTVMPSGSTPPYSVVWNTGSGSFSITGLAPGDYMATVTDNAGCTATATATVQSVSCSSFQASISSADVSCNGADDGMAMVNIAGAQEPITIFWNNFFITPTITNLAPGTYTATVTDAIGCAATVSATITEPAVLQLFASSSNETGVAANDGTAMATATGGTGPYSYAWSNGMTGAAIAGLPPANYFVTLTDGNGCTNFATVTVAAYLCSLQLNMDVQDASCPNTADGSAQVLNVPGSNGPISFVWSNGATSQALENLLPGLYTVTVTDGSGCTISGTAGIFGEDTTPPTALALSNLTLVLNENGNAFLTPDMVDNGSFDDCGFIEMVLSNDNFNCSEIGANTVTLIVYDSSGNTASTDITINLVDVTAPHITCPDDLVTNSCNGVSYELPIVNDNCEDAQQQLLQGLGSGEVFPLGQTTVQWQASDASGNVAACSFTVTVETDMVIENIEVVDAVLGQANGSIILVVAGGLPPYVQQWFQDANPLPGFDPQQVGAGTYSVIITDAAGCSVSMTDIQVNGINASRETSINQEISVYPNPSSGQVFIELKNGGKPLAINLYDVSGRNLPIKKLNHNNLDISALPPGVYWLKIEDDGQPTWKKIVKI